MMKPRPNAAPRRPKFFCRFESLLMSPTAAWATAMLPPVSPSIARPRNSSGMEVGADAEGEDDVADRRAGDGEGEHRLAAEAVGQLTQDGGGDERAQRIDRLQEAQHDEAVLERPRLGRHPERRVADEQGEDRDEDAEPDQVDEHGEEHRHDRVGVIVAVLRHEGTNGSGVRVSGRRRAGVRRRAAPMKSRTAIPMTDRSTMIWNVTARRAICPAACTSP